jgi:outer membrane protein OmpA-like peptidoglycan-associated protein
MKIFRPSLLALLLVSSVSWAENVKLYDKAPSVEELQRQLTGGTTAESRKKVRTRSIQFDASAQGEQGGADAPSQAQVVVSPPVSHSQAGMSSTGGGKAMQVGEQAIAFPISFKVNSSEVLPDAVPFIESIAGLLQKDPGMRLLIEGHTDSSGNPGRNVVLSRERAFSVMNYLVDRYRVDPMRLVPVGKGFSEPLGGTEPNNPKNRRVQFRIIG